MSLIYVINGPNLGRLELRDSALYGNSTLDEIQAEVEKSAAQLGFHIRWYQTESEAEFVRVIHESIDNGAAVIVNPGALTHYSYAIADALAMCTSPIIEVHISNIYARDEWRRESVVAPVAMGTISGLGPHGYVLAVEALALSSGERDQDPLK